MTKRPDGLGVQLAVVFASLFTCKGRGGLRAPKGELRDAVAEASVSW